MYEFLVRVRFFSFALVGSITRHPRTEESSVLLNMVVKNLIFFSSEKRIIFRDFFFILKKVCVYRALNPLKLELDLNCMPNFYAN